MSLCSLQVATTAGNGKDSECEAPESFDDYQVNHLIAGYEDSLIIAGCGKCIWDLSLALVVTILEVSDRQRAPILNDSFFHCFHQMGSRYHAGHFSLSHRLESR